MYNASILEICLLLLGFPNFMSILNLGAGYASEW